MGSLRSSWWDQSCKKPLDIPALSGVRDILPLSAVAANVWISEQCHEDFKIDRSSHDIFSPSLPPALPSRFSKLFQEQKKMNTSEVSCPLITSFSPVKSKHSFALSINIFSYQLFFFIFIVSCIIILLSFLHLQVVAKVYIFFLFYY